MWRLVCFVAVILLGAAIAAPVQAGFSLSGSVGSGYQLNGDTGRIPTNLMLGGHLDVLEDFLGYDVGLLVDMPDVDDALFDLQARTGLTLRLPVLPIFLRVVVGIDDVVHGPWTMLAGGGLGVEGLFTPFVGGFAEIDFLPRAMEGDNINVLEGRLGLYFEFF